MNEKLKEGEKKILVAGAEFATLHRGKHFRGKAGDGQVFKPADFTEVRLASLLASGALRWETIHTKTVTADEKKSVGETKLSIAQTKAVTHVADGYPTPLDKEN